jgi:predicted site-specific integrase-resolvase
MANRKKKMVIKNQINTNLAGPRLLPLKKAADYLGLTVWAMRERIWAGQIPVVQFPGGRKMYVDIQDIEAFIQKNKKVII